MDDVREEVAELRLQMRTPYVLISNTNKDIEKVNQWIDLHQNQHDLEIGAYGRLPAIQKDRDAWKREFEAMQKTAIARAAEIERLRAGKASDD